MRDSFTSEFFAGNRAKLRQLFTGTAPIVITANGLLQRTGEEAYPFYQDRDFWYLTGVDEPDVVLVMDKNKDYLIVPKRSAVREIFDGAIDKQGLQNISGVDEVLEGEEGWRQLSSRLKRAKHVATLASPSDYLDFWGMYTNPARAGLIKRIKELNPETKLLDLTSHLARMRVVKQAAELEAIQKAIDITIDAFKEATGLAKRKKYAYEYEIEANINSGFRVRGAGPNAFTSVVAGGKRACTLHHNDNSGSLMADELIVIDIGASYNHYAADITRTIALKEPTRRQLAVYEAVLDVHKYALSLLRPGVEPRAYEEKIEQFMGEKLRELGLIKTITHDEVRRYYPHATSHYLGLDAHDAGDRTELFPEGAVLTVEPGIYIPEENLGIRLEDDVLITKNGCKVLSNRLPKQLL